MTTGERIKAARIAAGMTQKELAEKVGVEFPAIHKYESGRIVNLKRSTIGKLAVALDVKPSYLMGFDDSDMTADTEDEKRLLRLFRAMDEGKRGLLLQNAEAFAK